MKSIHTLIVPSLLIIALSGCRGGATARADELAAQIREQSIENFVRSFSLHAPERAMTFAREQAHAPSVQTLLEQGIEPLEDDPLIREVLTLLYAERDYEPVFIFGAQLTPDGEAVIEAIDESWRHGLWPADYHETSLHERLDQLTAAENVDGLLDRLTLDTEHEEILMAYLLDNAGLDSTLPAQDAVFSVIAEQGDANPLPEYADTIDILTHNLEEVASAIPEVEVLIAAAYLRYARDQHLDNFHYITDEDLEANGWDAEDEAQHDEILRARMSANFRHASESVGFDVALSELPPQFEQYDLLMQGLAEYRDYVAGGPWPEVEVPEDVAIGDRDDGVPTLRRRLALEGYYDGDLESDRFDSEVSNALERYQRTHQLSDSGRVSDETRTSLNIPNDRRLAQIMVAMDRWRETRIGHDVHGEYFFINVPDFHAEFWDSDELIHRFRVIVGSRRRWRDDDGNYQVEGRTPLFSDTMEYIVFNPYWNVPPSILNQELIPEWEDDPTYFFEHHYEVTWSTTGRPRSVRQLPGPWNALGQIKFLFPNEHDVYMHDTPNRRLFDRDLRAFSHGCIRVENPFELARLILMRDRDLTEFQTERYIERNMESLDEQWTSLDRPIAVHLDYIGVRVDEDERVNFLSDIYSIDAPRFDAARELIWADFGIEPPVEEETEEDE